METVFNVPLIKIKNRGSGFMKHKCRKHFGRNKTKDTSACVTWADICRPGSLGWVGRNQTSACCRCPSAQRWNSAPPDSGRPWATKRGTPHKCLKRKHKFKKQHNKTIRCNWPRKKVSLKKENSLRAKSAVKLQIWCHVFRVWLLQKKKPWKAFPTPR